MGLLGDSIDDPKSMATYQLVAGLLSPGSFGQGLGKGLAGYQGALANSQDMEFKKQQIAASQQEQQLRDVQIRRAQQQMAFGQQFMDGMSPGAAPTTPAQPQVSGAGIGSPAPMGSPGMGAPAPSAPTAPASAQSKFASLTADQITGLHAAGIISKDQVDFWKSLNEGVAMQPGWRVRPGQAPEYLADPTKGIDFKNGTVSQLPGAADTQGALAAATAGGTEQGKNRQSLVPLDRLDRMPGIAPTSTVDDLVQSGKPASTPVGSVSPAQMAAVRADMQRQGGGAFSVNARPASAIPNLGGQPAAGGFKSPADLEAEKVAAVQPINFQTKMLSDAHTANVGTFDKLNDTLRSEAELQNRNQQLIPLLDKIQTGGFAPEARIGLANSLLTTPGLPESVRKSVSTWIANGDPTAGKVVENQLAAAGIKTMLDTLDKEGKPNRALFDAIHAEQESVKSGNATLKQVFDLQKQLYDWHLDQQQKMGDEIASPSYNPLTFQNKMARMRNESLAAPAATAPSVVDLPASPTASNLKVGTIYKLPNGQSGKWDGMRFKGQ